MNMPAGALRATLETYKNSMLHSCGQGLVSLIVYGSAVRGEFNQRSSDINILVVLASAAPDLLKKAGRPQSLRRFRRINPVYFTEEFMRCSADVFPIEFLDMKEDFFVLYGKDILGSFRFDPSHLRFQCEHELKSKLLQLNKAYSRFAGKPARLRPVLFAASGSLTAVLKNVLRLRSALPSGSTGEMLSRLGSEFHIDAEAFKQALEARQKRRLRPGETESLFIRLTRALEQVIDKVDSYKCSDG